MSARTCASWLILTALASNAPAQESPTPNPSPRHVGYEEAIGVNPPHEKFYLGRMALSGDGQRVWWYVYWDSVTPCPGLPIRVYSMKTDGTDVQESPLSTVEAKFVGGGFLATNRDGAAAIFEMEANRGPSEFAARSGSRFVRLEPGKPAESVFDADPVAHGPDTPFVSRGRGLRLNDAATMFFWCDGQVLWRAAAKGMGRAEPVVSVKHLNFHGPWNPFEGGALATFDINAAGDAWVIQARFTDPKTKQLRWEVAQAAGALPQSFRGIKKMTDQPFAAGVHCSDDLATIGFCAGGPPGRGSAFVFDGDAGRNLQDVGLPKAVGASGLILSDNGRRALLTITGVDGSGHFVLQNLDRNTRLPAGTSRYQRIQGGVADWAISDDGKTVAGAWAGRDADPKLRSIYVLHDGGPERPGFPSIGTVNVRVDEAADALVVRAQIRDATGLERVYALPFRNGADPCGFQTDKENPLFDIRYGGGVNLSSLLMPVSGAADEYEIKIPLRGKKALLDASYWVRIVAVNKAGTRTTYVDAPCGD